MNLKKQTMYYLATLYVCRSILSSVHNAAEEEETIDEGTNCYNALFQQAALLTGLIEQVDFSTCFMNNNPSLMDQHLTNPGTQADSR